LLAARFDVGYDPDKPIWYVECDNCSCAGPQIRPGVDTDGNYTKREAIEAWNTRSPKR
jgi:hypothetical protein